MPFRLALMYRLADNDPSAPGRARLETVAASLPV